MSVCGKFNPYFVCKCFQWFPLQMDAHVEPGIYAPGAVIDLGINVTNKSFRRVRNFHVQLVKVSERFWLPLGLWRELNPFYWLWLWIEGSHLLFNWPTSADENNDCAKWDGVTRMQSKSKVPDLLGMSTECTTNDDNHRFNQYSHQCQTFHSGTCFMRPDSIHLAHTICNIFIFR